MLVFRVTEKLGLIYLFGKGVLSYIFTSVIVIGGAIAVSLVFKKCYAFLMNFIKVRAFKEKSAV